MSNFLTNGVMDLRQTLSTHTMAIGGDGHYFEENDSPEKLKNLLDSAKETEKLKGMKWLLAMMSQGRNISEFFPYVVKNVMAKSVEVKKMVYIYLVHYADFDKRCREIALLSINSFQKDLAGHNQLIRGMALRVMTSIRVPDVIQIQLLAVRKCSTDHSPYVRKCAAIALPKLYAFDPLHLNELEEILAQLLQDTSTMVLGSSIAAFNEICPNNFKLIHPCYRKLCQLLADLDEWTQVPVLEMMTRYARKHFMDPSPGRAAAARQQAKNRSTAASKSQLSAFTAVRRRVMKKAFYSDEEDESDDEIVMLPAESDMKAAEKGSVFTGADADIEGDLDPDHRLLLKSSLPLLKSRNAGVVLGVASLHYYCGSRTTGTTVQLGKALVRILKNNREIQYVVLTSIITMAQEQPAMFTPYLSEFFIKSTDPIFNRLLKLDILAALTTRENAEIILRELQIYVRHSNPSFVCATVRAVGRIADVAPAFSDTCMEGLMHLLNCSPKNEVYGEVVVTLRQILQQNKHSKVSTTIIHKLLKLLLTSEKLKQIPVARASIIWLIGEFHEILRKLAPDILRILAQGFPDEETETKTQIVNFALKLSLRLPDDENVQTMMTYVLEMTRFDPDFDLRDRSRFMTAIMGLAPSSSVDETALELLSRHAESVLLAPKLPPLTLQGPVDLEGLPHFTLGSLSSVVGHYVKGYSPISPWPEKETDSRVREPVHETTPLSVNPKKEVTRVPENAAKTLNSFLSSSDEESENESSGSGSSDEESTSSEEEESGEDEALPVVKQNPPKAAAPVATKSGMRRVGGTIKKSDDSLISNQLNSESKSLLDLPDQPSTRFFEEPTSFSQPPTNSGYDLLADQFDLLQVQPSPSFSSNFFNGTPIQPSSQFPSPPATDETSILAQIMQSFPQQTSADRKPQSSSASNSETKMSPNVTQQEGMISFPKVILRPEIAQGLKISLLFRHHVRAMTLPGGSSVYLELSNSSPDYPIRRIRVNFPGDIRRTPIEEVSLLSPSESVRLPLEIVLRSCIGRTIRVTITSDRGQYTGEMMIELWEILSPLSLSNSDYDTYQRQLGGFSHTTATISLLSQQMERNFPSWITSSIEKKLNIYQVQAGRIYETMTSVPQDEWRFSGLVQKEMREERVLISITAHREGKVTLHIYADDAVMSSTLLDMLRKFLLSSSS